MISVSAITHATEDSERVRSNLRRLLGAELAVDSSEGHHGNPIEVSAGPAPGAAAAIAGAVPAELLERALGSGEGRAYLRLDKQAISEGRIALSDADPVRVTVSGGVREWRRAAPRARAPSL